MSSSEFYAALQQVASERGIPVDAVIDSIKVALATAYKKDRKEAGEDVELEEVTVSLDNFTGETRIFRADKDVTPAGFGRIAAQTARQVILQKIRETERTAILAEYKTKIGTIVSGHVFRNENGLIVMDLGKAQGVIPQSEQVQSEQYKLNQRLKVLVKDIREGARGTEIIVSRADPEFVKKLFEQEVPEIASGVVKFEAIAREAGSRTKIAVSSTDEKVDPVGSCVGQKGVRVQNIITELFGEKIDILPYSSHVEKFIAASLSPAKVFEVELIQDENRAVVSVPLDQQSLAIGREGQNARLANKLTKWKIDIKGVEGGGFEITGDGFATKEPTKEKKEEVGIKGIWDADIKEAKDRKDEEKEEEIREVTDTEEVKEEEHKAEEISTTDETSKE